MLFKALIFYFGASLEKQKITRMADQDIQESIFYQTNYNQSYSNLIQGDFECPSGGFRYVVVSNNTVNSQKTIDQLSSQVSSSEDVENLLDHVNWSRVLY